MLNFDKLINNGILNLYQLEGDNKYVVVIVVKEKSYIIPLIKDGLDSMAYISSDYSVSEYNKLQQIINTFFEKGMCASMYTYCPIRSNAPDHSMNVTSFIKFGGCKKHTKADAALVDAGYNIDRLSEVGVKPTSVDYSTLLTTDEFASKLYESDKLMVQAVGANYASLSDEIKMAAEGIRSGRSKGVVFTGPTGTGKSFACRVIAVEHHAPLMNIQITNGTTVEDLVGMFVPNDDASSDAKFKFVPGPLLVAYTKGYQVVLEEVNFGLPGIIAIVNQFTDFTPRITVYGKSYDKHPNFVVYMTMNPGYEGTETLNIALKNRFAIVDVPALTKDEYCSRAIGYSKMLGHELSYAFFVKLYEFSEFIEKEAKTSKWHENVKLSIRNAQRVCDISLLKKCSFDEFSAIIADEYLNVLSCDNDNSKKLAEFKCSPEVINYIKSIYDLYDFGEIEVIDSDEELESLFDDGSGDPAGDSKKSSHKKKLSEKLFDDED